jgi:glycosyltransferase involved in cell wall biosynthesis
MIKEQYPLVTIVMASYNSEKHIEEALTSISKQTYPSIELIVIDGGSNDNTIEIINKYRSIIRVLKSEKDDGIYDAWNKALKLSSGKWVTFIGSDDFFEDNCISCYLDHISQLNFEPDFVSSKIRVINEEGKTCRIAGEHWEWRKFKKFMNTLHVGTFHNRKLFEDVGLFDTNYKISADYELLLRKGEALKTSFLTAITCNMRMGGISTRNTMALKEAFIIKITTGKRNHLLAYYEYLVAKLKFHIRQIISF